MIRIPSPILKRPLSGLTSIEFLASIVMLVVILTTALGSYILSIQLNELSKHYFWATNAEKMMIEQMKSENFDNLYANRNNTTFSYANFNLNGRGFIDMDNTNPRLLLVTVSFCWQEANGRIIGECQKVGGIWVKGPDLDGDGSFSSPVQLTSYIYKLN